MTRACPECGEAAERARVVREVMVGHRSIPVEIEALRCTGCGEVLLHAGQMREMQREAAEIARRDDGLLSPAEIHALREQYGLSQGAFERLINAGPKTVTRWERGTVCQNGTADTLMRILRDHPDIAAEVARDRGIDLRKRVSAAPRR